MAMPAARVTCDFNIIICSKNLRYRLVLRYTPRYLLEGIFSMANKNLRLRLISKVAVGCACELNIFLMATRTCAIAWFAAIPIANTI